MSEITREQIETIYRYSVDFGDGASRRELQALCRLALQALDHAADARLGARLRSILDATGHDAESLEAAEGDPTRAELADFILRLVVALREDQADVVRGEGR